MVDQLDSDGPLFRFRAATMLSWLIMEDWPSFELDRHGCQLNTSRINKVEVKPVSPAVAQYYHLPTPAANQPSHLTLFAFKATPHLRVNYLRYYRI